MTKKAWPLRVPIYCAELDEFTGQYICACEGGFQTLMSKGDVYVVVKNGTRTTSKCIAGLFDYISTETSTIKRTNTVTGVTEEIPFEPNTAIIYMLMMSNDPRLEKILTKREKKFSDKNSLIMGIMGATVSSIDESASKSREALSKLKLNHG